MKKENFIKHDSNKIKVSLLEPDFIIGVAEVATFGANKYSSYGIIPEDKTIGRISKAWNVNTVTKVIRYTKSQEKVCVGAVIADTERKDLSANIATKENKFTSKVLWSAETATTNGLNKKTQYMQTDKEKTLENGLQLTLNESPVLESTSENGTKIQKENVSIKKEDGLIHYLNTGLHKVIMIVNLKKGAVSADKALSNTLISTTATILESSEEYFVVGATTDSECLETIYLVLEELSLISRPLKKLIVRSGKDNWKLCEDLDRYKDATLRHLFTYLKGEKIDKESGLSHLHHASCNLMFLDYFDRKENDNASR